MKKPRWYELGFLSDWTNTFVSFAGFFRTKNPCLGCVSPVTDVTTYSPHIEPQTSALDILMSLLKHLSTSLNRSSPQPQFHVPHFKKVIDAFLTCPPSERGGKKRSAQEAPSNKLDVQVRDQFVAKWLNVYADIRWFFLRDAECDFVIFFLPFFRDSQALLSPVLSSASPKTNPFVSENLLFLLERLKSFPASQSDLKSWWVEELQAKPVRSKKAATGLEPDASGTDSESDSIEDDWRKFFDEEDKQKKPSEPSMRLHQMTVHQSLHSLASHRAVFTRLWLRLLPRLSEDEGGQSLRVLNVMHHGIMPHLTRAVLVMDWVGRCVDYGEPPIVI